MHLDAPDLLERVDDRVLVGPDGEGRPGLGEGAGGADAVGEVALGRRAEDRAGPGPADERHVVVGEVGGVDERGRGGEHALVREQPRGGATVERVAGEVLPGLLGQVRVERPPQPARRLPDHGEVVAGDGPHGVHGGSDPPRVAGAQGRHPLGPVLRGAVGEPLLHLVEREVAVGRQPPGQVERVEEGEPDAGRGGRLDEGEPHRVGVARRACHPARGGGSGTRRRRCTRRAPSRRTRRSPGHGRSRGPGGRRAGTCPRATSRSCPPRRASGRAGPGGRRGCGRSRGRGGRARGGRRHRARPARRRGRRRPAPAPWPRGPGAGHRRGAPRARTST